MSTMKLVVGYLATPGGADAVALGVRLARTLGAELELCIVLPADRGGVARLAVGDFDDHLTEQAQKWLDEAAVPSDVVARSHVSFTESFTDGLIREIERLGADAIVVGGSGGGLAGPFSLGSVVNELLHSSPVPVAVAPRGTRHTDVDRVREVTCAIGARAQTGCCAPRFDSARPQAHRCGWRHWWLSIRRTVTCAATRTPCVNGRSSMHRKH
jgi:nucleotide-binding universal stress UspA family protein